MTTPATALTPVDLWAQITAMPRPHRTVDFPRLGENGEPVAQMVIQVLTQEEQITTSIEAERFTRKHIKDMPKQDEPRRGYDDTYNNQAACEILFRACRRMDDLSMPFFPSPSAIRQKLTADEIGVLFRGYLIIRGEVGPILAEMSEEEVTAFIKRLQEGGSAFPLAFLSPEQLIALVLSMAKRLSPSATVSSSPGSPPDSPTTPEMLETPADDDGIADAPAPDAELLLAFVTPKPDAVKA